MIKVHIPVDSSQKWGGAWTFIDNFKNKNDYFELTNLDDAQVILIAGASMITGKTLTKLKNTKKPIILRLDGIPEDWRNSGRGWSRLKNAYLACNGVINQSNHVYFSVFNYLRERTDYRPDHDVVILNGVDKSIFKEEGEKFARFGETSYISVNSRKDPNKRIEEIIERFRRVKTDGDGKTLTFVGKYPTYLRENNFGLYDLEEGKDWQYLGIIKNKVEMAKIMRSCDTLVFPSFGDPCPNTVIEALHCGLEPILVNDYGGTSEIIEKFEEGYDFSIDNMLKQYHMFLKIHV